MTKYRIVKIVSLPNGQSAEFYCTPVGLWTMDKQNSKIFDNEYVVDHEIRKLNNKADKHICNKMSGQYQITTYIKEEV